jgi:hypothetical protein
MIAVEKKITKLTSQDSKRQIDKFVVVTAV